MAILKDLAKTSSCTLIVVTHDARIYSFADHIAEMEDGRVYKITEQNGG